MKGNLSSKTATKLVREWIDLHTSEIRKWLATCKTKSNN